MRFNSRDKRFKSPFGAVKSGEDIYLYVGGASSARLELFEDGCDAPIEYSLEPADGGCCATISIPKAGLYFYRFWADGCYLERGNGGEGVVTSGGGTRFQLTVYDDFSVPARFKGGVMYQIFPDSFCNSGAPKSDVPVDRAMQPLTALPDHLPDSNGRYSNKYYGGDLKGIEQKLPYLSSIGVTMLYLNPIFEAHSNHRYNTANYMKIDPMLGTLEDFRSLCANAKQQGISIILDGVFSHTGDDSIYFDKYRRYNSDGAYHNHQSPYYKWYRFKSRGYSSWWNIPTLPETDETEQSFVDFICGKGGVIDYWMTNGASGFRLDVADELPDGFIAVIREAVKRHKGFLIGEVWEDASNKISYSERRRYLLGHELDSVMNYPFKQAIIAFLKTGDAARFAEAITEITENYPKPVTDALMNLLSTHDTPRIITELAANQPYPDKAAQREFLLSRDDFLRGLELQKLAFALSFTLPGFPSIYYGDEIAMQGFGDPFCRAYYQWENPPADLRGLVTELAETRRKSPAFKDGDCRFIFAQNGAVAFVRQSGKHKALIIVNRGSETAEIEFGGKTYACPPWRHIIIQNG